MYSPVGGVCILLFLSNFFLLPLLLFYSLIASLQMGEEANLQLPLLWKRLAQWVVFTFFVCVSLVAAEVLFELATDIPYPTGYIRANLKPGMSQQQINDLLLQQYDWVSIEPLKETDGNNKEAVYEQRVFIRYSILMEAIYLLYYDRDTNFVDYFSYD